MRGILTYRILHTVLEVSLKLFSLGFTNEIILVTLDTRFKTNKNFYCQIYFRYQCLAQHKVCIYQLFNYCYGSKVTLYPDIRFTISVLLESCLLSCPCVNVNPDSYASVIQCTVYQLSQILPYLHITLLGTTMRNPLRSFFLNYSKQTNQQTFKFVVFHF